MRLNNLCDWALGSLLRCLIPKSTSTQLAEHAFSGILLSAQRMLVINEHDCQEARQVTVITLGTAGNGRVPRLHSQIEQQFTIVA